MSDKCNSGFIKESDVHCECFSVGDLRERIAEAAKERPDIPRGQLKECAYLVGCNQGWTQRGTVYASTPGAAYRQAKAIADAHQEATGHGSGVINVGPCISEE